MIRKPGRSHTRSSVAEILDGELRLANQDVFLGDMQHGRNFRAGAWVGDADASTGCDLVRVVVVMVVMGGNRLGRAW